MRVRRGRDLQKKRSKYVERSFAHICETGGARRMWQRGIEKVTKRYQLAAAARNLGLIMRKLFGVGKPRCLQGLGVLFCARIIVLERLGDVSRVAQNALNIFSRAPRSTRAILMNDQFALAGI